MAKKRKKKKTKSYKKQSRNLAQFRKRLFGGKHDPQVVFRDLHAFKDFREVNVAAKFVSNPSNPYHRLIFGLPFAKSYSEVRSKHYFAFTENLQRDLDWMSLSIVRYAKEISLFVNLSASFQKAFLLGAYDKANAVLESISSEFGLSLWLLEKSFLISEYASGLEANKKLQTQIVGDETNDILLQIIGEYISLRCETKLSVENYCLRLVRDFEEISESVTNLKAYLRYRLENLSMDLAPVASNITFYEGASPIVDRYLTFIAILQSCAVGDSSFYKIASKAISRISCRIQDPRIETLLQFFIPERPLEWNSSASSVVKILDDYTDGHYENSAKASANFIVENPEVYELYYIYIRSLNHMGKAFNQVFPKKSVAASILAHTNVLISGETSWSDSADALSKLSYSLWRDPLAYGLYGFYVQEALPAPDKKFHKLALLNTSHLNPRFAKIYREPDKANRFLDQLSQKIGNSSTFSLIRELTQKSHNDEDFEFPLSIPETRRQIYTATIHAAAARPQRAIAILKPLLTEITEDQLPDNFHTLDRITRTLFQCYLDTKQLAECTDMVICSYLRNELSTRKIPLTQLVKAIDETSPPDVMRKMTYPILFLLVDTKPRAIYVAYDNFLSSIGVHRPSQLLDMADQFHPEVLREFLYRVCKIDVLACSYHFNGTKDLETERICICQFLSKSDPKNLKTYSDEISTITSRSLIREGMRQIEVSKIYVDESGVRNTGRKLLEESFVRYRELASMSSIETLRMLPKESLHLYELTEDGRIIEKPISIEELLNTSDKRFVHDSHFLLFKELFIDIRDRFISSGEHGLDGYLSVRIRHGVLQNQIRSPFEILHLISEKDTTTGEYLLNPYWNTNLKDVSGEVSLLIHELLANFSREVDDEAQKLNKDLIQVKTEKKNPNGLFDYEFSIKELFGLFESEFVDIRDFDQFLDAVFRILWMRTKENLVQIQEVISTDLKNAIYNSISKLDREIRNLIVPAQATELLQNIARCQTDVQYNLDSVAQWFTISRSSMVPQFSVSNLVNICTESINNIYPHKNVNPVTEFDSEVVIDGEFFAPFFDIVRTLMDNILVHSGLPPEKMGIKIESETEGDLLILRIKNNLDEVVQESDPVATLSSINSSIKPSEIAGVIAKEGRSGLMKVRKLMAIDLQRKHSTLDFSYDEDGKFVVILGMDMGGLRK